MASKALLYTIGAVVVIAAGAIVISSGEPPRDFECKDKDCPVPVAQKLPFASLQVANKVTVKPGGKLTWTLTTSGIGNTHFHPTMGIKFADPGFDACHVVDPPTALVYECTNNGTPGEHKYTIFTVGFGSRDKDPFVVNN